MATIPIGTYYLKDLISLSSAVAEELGTGLTTYVTGYGTIPATSWWLNTNKTKLDIDDIDTPKTHYRYNNGWFIVTIDPDSYDEISIDPSNAPVIIASANVTVSTAFYNWFMSNINVGTPSYSVTYITTNVTRSNNQTLIDNDSGYRYRNVFTLADGYTAFTYHITMGGVEQTTPNVIVSGNRLTVGIDEVIGNVVCDVTGTNNSYNLYFYTDPNMTPIPARTNITNIAFPLPTPTRTGSTFDGHWYNTQTGANNHYTNDYVVNGQIITANKTIYAGWNTPQYRVTLDPDGGTVTPTYIDPQNNTFRLTDLPTPSKSGVTFQYWKFSDDSRVDAEIEYTITANVTLTAVYDNTVPITPTVYINDRIGKKWTLSASQLDSVVSYINSGDFTATIAQLLNGKSLFSAPSQYIISVKMYPLNLATKETLESGENMTVGGAEIHDPHIQPNPPVLTISPLKKGQIHDVATFNFTGLGNDFRNFQSRFDLYLPFYGFVQLDVHHTVGKTVDIQLIIDYGTGIGTYYIIANDTIVQTVNAEIGTSIAVGFNDAVETARNMALQTARGTLQAIPSIANGSVSGLLLAGANTALNVVGMATTHITKGINADSFNAWYQPLYCYVIKTSPAYYYPPNFNALVGRPLLQSRYLNQMHGFTTVSSVHVENIPNATMQELTLIETQLRNGVIF